MVCPILSRPCLMSSASRVGAAERVSSGAGWLQRDRQRTAARLCRTDLARLPTAALLPLPPTDRNNREIIGTRTAPLPAALDGSRMGTGATQQTAPGLEHHRRAAPGYPWLPRRDEEGVHKGNVVVGHVRHLAQPLPLSFRTLRVIRAMNESFQGSAGGEPAHACHRLSDLPKDTQPVPEVGTPTVQHRSCPAMQSSCHHPSSSPPPPHSDEVLSLLLAAQAGQGKA